MLSVRTPGLLVQRFTQALHWQNMANVLHVSSVSHNTPDGANIAVGLKHLRDPVRQSDGADAARLRADDVARAAAALRHGVLQDELRHLRAFAAPCDDYSRRR